MARLALLFVVLTAIVSATLGRFVCPPHLTSYCFASDENEFKIHCATNATSAFDITVQPDRLLRIRCRNSPDWSAFLHGSSLSVGSVERFVVSSCAPPGPRYATKIVQWQLNLQGVRYLKYENLLAPLDPRDLEAFPDAVHLALFNNPAMGEARPDLLRGLPRLEQLEMRNANVEIPRGFFAGSSSLKAMELSGNSLKSLLPGIFDSLDRLKLLNLRRNGIEEVRPGAFRDLRSLISLDIQQNELRALPIDVFADLPILETVNLGGNNFTSLPADLFLFNPKLKIVKLSYNRANLTTLPTGLLANFTDLRVVLFAGVGLTRLPENLLRGSSSLLELNLSENYLSFLPIGLLRDATGLRTLNLAFNDLRELDAGIFSSCSKLVRLDLSWNHLTSVGEHTFTGLESLQELNVEHNDLSHVHVDAFVSLTELRIAKFAHNELTLRTGLFDIFGHVSPFHPCSSLEKLYLSHNNVSEMFGDWVISGTNLRSLDLSHNSFQYLQSEDLQFMSNKITVNLTHNKIGQVDLTRLEQISKNHSTGSKSGIDVPRNVSVLLASNPIQCSCDIYPLLRYLKNQMIPQARDFAQLHVEELTCDGPDYAEGLLLTELDPGTFRCLLETEIDPCANCSCWLAPANDALLLDCSARNLSSAPEWIDTRGIGRVEIDLSMNQLTVAPNMSALGYDRVTSLNLAENKIGTVDESLIAPGLKVLRLDGNNLTSIDLELLNRLLNESNLERLTLHDNPWRCDCSSLGLFSFVQSSYQEMPELLKVTCGNSELSPLSIEELCPTPYRFLLVLCTLVGSIGLLIGSVLAFYFRHRPQIKTWQCWKNSTEDDKATCNGFAIEELIARDRMQIARKESGVVVLSGMENVWGRVEFNEGRARLVVQEMAVPDLRTYLRMNACVECHESWLWKRRMYALTHSIALQPRMIEEEQDLREKDQGFVNVA